MKTALGTFAALLLGCALCIQTAHAQVQVQPAPGFSVQIGPEAPPPPEGWRERAWEERHEEAWRERERERCRWIGNPAERHECFENVSR